VLLSYKAIHYITENDLPYSELIPSEKWIVLNLIRLNKFE